MVKTFNIKNFMFTKLAQDISEYYADQSSKILCPACFDFFPLSNITLAHIIPKSFKGNKCSLLCTRCNNFFGSNQDKWFGEYLNLISDEDSFILDAKSKSKYITINGKKVRGDIKTGSDGVIEVDIIHFCKEDAQRPLGGGISISQDVHLLSHEREILVGYLTAAYMLWFSSYGYSWALQNTLDIVRQQMGNPSDVIINHDFSIDIDGFYQPCIGLLQFGSNLVPSALIYDKLVFFPNANGLFSYEKISKLLSSDSPIGSFKSIASYESHKHPPFIGLICGDQKIIIPQPFLNGEMLLKTVLYFDSPHDQPEFFHLDTNPSS